MLSSASRRVWASLAAPLSLIVVTAAVAAPRAPSKSTIVIKGSTSFKPNQYLQLNDKFAPGTVSIGAGGTVTISNVDTEGHTLSLVKKSDVPRTANQINNCGICGQIFTAHGFNPNGPPTSGPPPHPLLNAGGPGFDKPGDSIVIGPKGHGSKVSFKVSAKHGTTLYFICVIHPWMQGRFTVK